MATSAIYEELRQIATYPKHFHNGSEMNVVESRISSQPTAAIREFCRFVLQVLQDEA